MNRQRRTHPGTSDFDRSPCTSCLLRLIFRPRLPGSRRIAGPRRPQDTSTTRSRERWRSVGRRLRAPRRPAPASENSASRCDRCRSQQYPNATAIIRSTTRPQKQIRFQQTVSPTTTNNTTHPNTNATTSIMVDVCFSCISGTAASWLFDTTPFTTTGSDEGNYLRVYPTYSYELP